MFWVYKHSFINKYEGEDQKKGVEIRLLNSLPGREVMIDYSLMTSIVSKYFRRGMDHVYSGFAFCAWTYSADKGG